jgi:hypothetical protein
MKCFNVLSMQMFNELSGLPAPAGTVEGSWKLGAGSWELGGGGSFAYIYMIHGGRRVLALTIF